MTQTFLIFFGFGFFMEVQIVYGFRKEQKQVLVSHYPKMA